MEINYSENRISVGEAAKMLCMPEQRVRILMQRDKLPIGIADMSDKAENNYTYYIYKSKIIAYLTSANHQSGGEGNANI